MELQNVCEVRHTMLEREANNLLSKKDENWVLLGVSPGQDVDGSPCILYSIGRVLTFFDLAKDK